MSPARTPSRKRTAPDDDVAEVEPSAKRTKINGTSATDIASPSKKRKLEEDGLVLLDGANDRMDQEDVIVID